MKTIFKFIGWLFGIIIFIAFLTINFAIFGVNVPWVNNPILENVSPWQFLSIIIIDIYYVWSEWKSFRREK